MTDAISEFPDWLTRLRHCDAVALRSGDEDISYARLYRWAAGLAALLVGQGVQAGTRVAVLARDARVFATALHALRFARAVMIPVNVRLTPGEIAWQMQRADVGFTLCDAGHRSLWDATGCANPVFALSGDDLRDGGSLLAGADRMLESAVARMLEQSMERVNATDVQSIVFTSGTTGHPKGARITYANHLYGAAASAFRLGALPDDRWLTPLPLFHVGGQAVLMRSAMYGSAAVVHDAFDPMAVNRSIDHEGITLLSVVPSMLARMLRERGDRPYPAALRCILLGGGAAPAPLVEECLRRGVPIAATYGLTEANSQVATLAPADARRKVGSSGQPLAFSEVRIVGADGRPAAPLAEGEILVRGPTVADGYDRNGEATAAAFRDGWLHTGDIGYLDEEGFLFVLDRRTDLIVSGGENVYPAEVEAALLAHPDVLEAGVVGVPDEQYGQAPLAVVRLREGSAAGLDLPAFCRVRLAAYKAPRHVRVVSGPLPRNAAGKLLRQELRGLL